MAVVLVVIGLVAVGYSLPFSLVLGALAAATAPRPPSWWSSSTRPKGPGHRDASQRGGAG